MADAGPAIEVKGLRKSFGSTVVLDGIDFSRRRRGSLSPCSAPTGRARPRSSIS